MQDLKIKVQQLTLAVPSIPAVSCTDLTKEIESSWTWRSGQPKTWLVGYMIIPMTDPAGAGIYANIFMGYIDGTCYYIYSIHGSYGLL